MALHSAIKGKLISVIGDEVRFINPNLREKQKLCIVDRFYSLKDLFYFEKDTCVGFLLGGIGEINKNRHPNFMVVDKSKYSIKF